MKSTIVKIVLLGLGMLLLQFGCATQQIKEEKHIPFISKTFSKEYDEVWKALEEIMVEELVYPIKVKDKKRGIIETDWISVIRIRGTLRWNMKVLLDRKGNVTEVKVYNLVEEPAEKIRGKFKDKKGEIKTGWQASEEKVEGVDDILNLLSVRLEKE
jgi:hypothetical protein